MKNAENQQMLHIIGNAHIDPVWLWRWQDGYTEVLATFQSALDRMKTDPDFKFTSACSIYYEWVEKTNPAMFEEIRERVREGRWALVGGWLLQPDCNLPGGESFARHALLAQRYFKDKFGVVVKTGYNVDSFGHSASLPKILRRSCMENYVFMRPNPTEMPNPHDVFLWQSDDGSRVRAFRIHSTYCITESRFSALDELQEKMKADGLPRMAFFGVGNHGGGVTVKNLRAFRARGKQNEIFSTPDAYFAAIADRKLSVVATELQHHAIGCYSAYSPVKAALRRCEHNLLTAEKLSVMAKHIAGLDYPRAELTAAWKNLLFNQFHDIAGGCSIESAYRDADHFFGETMALTERVINRAAQAMMMRMNTGGKEAAEAYKRKENFFVWEHDKLGTPVVVFNPHTWPVKQQVFVRAKAKRVTDENGRNIPMQLVRGEQSNSRDDIYVVSFVANVPPLGYATYRLFDDHKVRQSAGGVRATSTLLENKLIRVIFDENTGDVKELYDKKRGKSLLTAPCRAVLVDETECDTWAHNKASLGEEVAAFGTATCEIVEHGPVRTVLRTRARCGESVIDRRFVMYPDSPVLTVKTFVDFHEHHKTLKLSFPTGAATHLADTAFGTVKRVFGRGEDPCRQWIASGELLVANDSKYGYDTEGDEMRLTVLRGAVFADHFGKEERKTAYRFMDQGEHYFSYAIAPFTTKATAHRVAEELNAPLRPFFASFHDGDLPLHYQGLEVNRASVMVSAIKQCEDNDCNVIRLFETEGKKTEVRIDLFGKTICACVGRNAIETLREDGKKLNLVEWEETL